METAVEIVGLLVSPIHAYEGRPDDGPRPDPDGRRPTAVEVRAGLGLVGDRYFGRPAHRRAAVTLLAAESMDAIARELDLPGTPDPLLARRNLVLRGFPVDELAAGRDHPGALFSLDTGDGPVRFQAHRPANPCRWMDVVLAPGAFRAMRGRGGGANRSTTASSGSAPRACTSWSSCPPKRDRPTGAAGPGPAPAVRRRTLRRDRVRPAGPAVPPRLRRGPHRASSVEIVDSGMEVTIWKPVSRSGWCDRAEGHLF